MNETNIREGTPLEAAANKCKQAIMAKHGINVKIDGSWGPWQQEQWDKLQYQVNIERQKTFHRVKIAEIIVGVFLLLPAIFGVFCFLLSFFDFHGDFADLRNLRGDWTDGDYNASPAPLFMGLTAIPGVALIIDFLRYKEKQLK